MPPLLLFVLPAAKDNSVCILHAEEAQTWFCGCCPDKEIEIHVFLKSFLSIRLSLSSSVETSPTHSSLRTDVPTNATHRAVVKAYSCLVCLPLQ